MPGKRDFKVKHLQASNSRARAIDYLRLLDQLDGSPRSPSERARDQFLKQALHLSLKPEVQRLFDLREENEETRQRYGRHSLGQSCLLARRLVEGGVRTVFVRDKGWDHHRGIAHALTYGFPPKLEAMNDAVAALFHDLQTRGMLEKTTVLLASEFGRTPRLNPSGGRDHWSRASSVLLFGGGLKRGVVVGKTDARGEEPIERPISPADLFHTLLFAVGLTTSHELTSPNGRPISVVDEMASSISEVLAS